MGSCPGFVSEQKAEPAPTHIQQQLRILRANWRAEDALGMPSAIDLADRIDVLAELMMKGGGGDG